MELTGIILCGGKSSRMGEDKGLVKYRGRQMVEYSIRILNYFTDNIFISSSNKTYEKFGYPLVPDLKRSLGPMGGIYSVMSVVKAKDYLILPCDTPNVTVQLIKKIIYNAEESDIVIPVTEDNKIHPLIGFYSCNIYSVLKKQMNSGNYKMQDLLSVCNTHYCPVDDSTILKNINTKSDLK